jgi:hypothetical protein
MDTHASNLTINTDKNQDQNPITLTQIPNTNANENQNQNHITLTPIPKLEPEPNLTLFDRLHAHERVCDRRVGAQTDQMCGLPIAP